METTRAIRSSYHHGDLRNALVAEAVELARAGGPGAVVLREAARRVGVSATAAYRHFEGHGDLLQAVKAHALDALADSMVGAAAEGVPAEDPGDEAERRLRASVCGYIRFALREPGLFRAAFQVEGIPEECAAPSTESRSYALLKDLLDTLVACARIPKSRRPYAETTMWATVHGLATLIDGPLGHLPEDQRRQAVERAFDSVMDGLCQRRPRIPEHPGPAAAG